mgnify:FL=1
MSTDIEFRRGVITAPATHPISGVAFNWHIGIIEVGSNNLIGDDGRIARRTVTQYAATRAGAFLTSGPIQTALSVEMGMVRMGGGQATAEGYIRAWRKALKHATPLDQAACSRFKLTLSLTPDDLRNLNQSQIDAAQETCLAPEWYSDHRQERKLAVSAWVDDPDAMGVLGDIAREAHFPRDAQPVLPVKLTRFESWHENYPPP